MKNQKEVGKFTESRGRIEVSVLTTSSKNTRREMGKLYQKITNNSNE